MSDSEQFSDLTMEETEALLDSQCQKYLSMPFEEFSRRCKAGEEFEYHPMLVHIAMLAGLPWPKGAC